MGQGLAPVLSISQLKESSVIQTSAGPTADRLLLEGRENWKSSLETSSNETSQAWQPRSAAFRPRRQLPGGLKIPEKNGRVAGRRHGTSLLVSLGMS